MKDIAIIKNLVGQRATEEDMKFIDCFLHPKLGLFIPISGSCGYASRENHSHPSYMVTILFDKSAKKRNHYRGEIISPGIKHNDYPNLNYYALCIEKEYFEQNYLLYEDSEAFLGNRWICGRSPRIIRLQGHSISWNSISGKKLQSNGWRG